MMPVASIDEEGREKHACDYDSDGDHICHSNVISRREDPR